MNILRWGGLLLALMILPSLAQAAVHLSSYTFQTNNLPLIFSDESHPQPYKLRAKIRSGPHADFHMALNHNNHGQSIQSVPGPGVFEIELYWVLYASDGVTIVDVQEEYLRNIKTVTVQSASNSPPTIQWTQNPSIAQEGQQYFIQAFATDPNGNLTEVNIWKFGTPFAFNHGGNGSSNYSGNPSIDTGGQTIVYIAQSRDAAGATSPAIVHSVLINKKPSIWWEIAPSSVPYQSAYSIRARAQDVDGNMTTVNIYRIRNNVEEPFAFELNGHGWDAYSENPDSASSYSVTTYRAEAIDQTGVSSGSIYHQVHVINQPPNAAWSSNNPGTVLLPSGAVKINTFIGQPYSFTASGSDINGNLKEVRTYDYAWEDVQGEYVLRYNYRHFATISSPTGNPVSQTFDRTGGSPWKWNYEYVAIAEDTANVFDNPFGDNILQVQLDNRNPGLPTLASSQTSIVIGQSVIISGAGTDPDGNATLQYLWYRKEVPGTNPPWIPMTSSTYANGTGNTVVNFTFTPTESGRYVFKTQVDDPYGFNFIADVSPVDVVPDTTRPNAPTNLAVTGASPTFVYLTWTKSTSSDVTEQHAYSQLTSGGTVTDSLLGFNVTGVSITDLTPGGTYRFYVKAKDGSGNLSDPSNEVVTTTPVAPAIFDQPDSITRTAGQTASFSVGVSGSTPISYQWIKNGQNLANSSTVSGAQLSTLVLTDVQSGDATNYKVAVSNSGGNAMSAEASLTVVPAPPTLNSQPGSLVVSVGQPASFSVSAAGTAPLSYQWYKNNSQIAGATTNSYTIQNSQVGDAANSPGYHVVVSNPAGSVASNTATLAVTTGGGQIAKLINSWSVGGLVGSYPGVTGTYFQVGSTNVIVHGFGVYVADSNGYYNDHRIRLYDLNDNLIAEVSVSLVGATPGELFVNLSSPITLNANQKYYLLFNVGYDSVYNFAQAGNNGVSSDITILDQVTLASGWTGFRYYWVADFGAPQSDRNGTAAGVNLKYTLSGGQDTTLPTVQVTQPEPSANVFGNAVAIQAIANDNIGIAGVQFMVNGIPVQAEDTVYPYAINWDSTTIQNGTHSISARAKDLSGNVKVSDSVNVTVSNVGELKLINSWNAGGLVGSYSGVTGTYFQVGQSDITLTALGVLVANTNGYYHDHRARIYDLNDNMIAEVSLNLVGAQTGELFSQLSAPVTLNAGQKYYLLFNVGYDSVYNLASAGTNGVSTDVTILDQVTIASGWTGSRYHWIADFGAPQSDRNGTAAGVTFKYTRSGGGQSPQIDTSNLNELKIHRP